MKPAARANRQYSCHPGGGPRQNKPDLIGETVTDGSGIDHLGIVKSQSPF
ncbi:hypothetical protein PO124_12030 [Bacillus licheniformis]|nr:hypothetical protein [Bacillus licheniformis]